MIQATYLTCLSSVACLIPAFISHSHVTIVDRHEERKLLPSRVTEVSSIHGTLPVVSCIPLQGRVGIWERNLSFHKNYKYKELGWIIPNRPFKDRDHGSKLFWKDEYCPISTMSKDGFCSVMEKMGFTRMFILGDSLQYMAAISLLHHLDFDYRNIVIHSHKKHQIMRSSQVLQCTKNFSVDIVFHRYNHVWPSYAANYSLGSQELRRATKKFIRQNPNNTGKMFEYFQCPHMSFPDVQGFCPWVHDYLNSTYKTIIWANVGAHFHHIDFFRQSVKHFEDFLLTYQRPNDWVVLRTLHPGQRNCSQEEEPYFSFPEYLSKGLTNTYDWNLFVEFNRIFEELAFKSRANGWTGAKVHLHDIYWMTALRKDGHPSEDDCLHYLLPGPPDFWSHTLFSILVEEAYYNKKRFKK